MAQHIYWVDNKDLSSKADIIGWNSLKKKKKKNTSVGLKFFALFLNRWLIDYEREREREREREICNGFFYVYENNAKREIYI